MAFPFPNPLLFLKHYVLMRWCCVRCGWFETGTIIHLHAANCPKCRAGAKYVDHCDGQTTRPLPFTSKPRLDATPDSGSWQITHAKGLVNQLGSDKQSRRRGGLKATGRPKKVRP